MKRALFALLVCTVLVATTACSSNPNDVEPVTESSDAISGEEPTNIEASEEADESAAAPTQDAPYVEEQLLYEDETFRLSIPKRHYMYSPNIVIEVENKTDGMIRIKFPDDELFYNGVGYTAASAFHINAGDIMERNVGPMLDAVKEIDIDSIQTIGLSYEISDEDRNYMYTTDFVTIDVHQP